MPIDPRETIYYKRARFTTRLPVERRYDRSHFWLQSLGDGLYRVGATKFATRMLGDLVEIDFQVELGNAVTRGQVIGTIEGFKAVSDLYCAATGEFVEWNSALLSDPTRFDRDPYGAGWLYVVRGEPAETAVDVKGYMALLDATIERMLAPTSESSDGRTC